MSQDESKKKSKTSTERSHEYRKRKRLGLNLVRSIPKASAIPAHEVGLCKRFAAKQESLLLKSVFSSSSALPANSRLKTARSSKKLEENDGGLSAFDHTSPDILEPICTVNIKEERLEDGLSPFGHVSPDILEPICTVFVKEEPIEVQEDRLITMAMENIQTYTLREKLEAVMKGSLLLPPKPPAMTAAERVRRYRARRRGIFEEDCLVNLGKSPLSRKNIQHSVYSKSHAVKPTPHNSQVIHRQTSNENLATFRPHD